MLVRGELFGANAEALIDGPKVEIAVTQRREPSLNADLAVTGATVCLRMARSRLIGLIGRKSSNAS